jgi:signal transduction histidine kinase
MKIKKKLLLVFTGFALLVGIIGYLANSSLREITSNLTQIRKSSVLEVEGSTEMAFELIIMHGLSKEFIYEAAKDHAAELPMIKTKLEESFTGFEKALKLREEITADGLKFYQGEELEEEKNELIKIKYLEHKYRSMKEELVGIIAGYQKNGNIPKHNLNENDWNSLVAEATMLKTDAQEEIISETDDVEREAKNSTNSMLWITGISFLAAIFAGILIATSITTPILKLKAAAQNIALGNMELITHIQTRDEIGDLIISFNKMTTDLQKSRTQVEEYSKTLEQKVNERTKELENSIRTLKETDENLKDYARDLKNSNAELEQFAYIASHDLQEPLRTISNFVDLFQRQYKGKVDKKADQYLAFIMDAADRMRTLITDLLTYSRIGAKKELKKTDTQVIVQKVLADLNAAIIEAKADITACSLPVISCYPGEIKQLFQNLVINAIKFRKENIPPQIRICCEQTDGFWKFSFADNGIGIAQHHNEKIFAIFQRLHTRKEYEGSGIGLSNCKKIVELHKGKIWVESTPGEGSTFYFTLPAAEARIQTKIQL